MRGILFKKELELAYLFPNAPAKTFIDPEASGNTSLFSLSSGVWKPQIKVLAGLHFHCRLQGDNPFLPSSSSGSGIPWLVAISLGLLLPSSHGLLCVCLISLCLTLGFRTHLNNSGKPFQDPNIIISTKPLQYKVIFRSFSAQDLISWGATIHPTL